MDEEQKSAPETRWWDPLTAVLLLALVLTAASRLVVTRWTEDLGLVGNLAVMGAVVGIALGQSKFSPRIAGLLAFGYMATLSAWQLTYTVKVDMGFQDQLYVVGRRIGETIWVLLHSQPVNDNLFFISVMSLLYFGFAVHAGYTLTRYATPWRVVLPFGLVLIVIHSYDPLLARRALFLAAYLLFGLILVARVTYLRNRHEWKLHRTKVPQDAGFDWIRFTLAVVLAITILAWTVPALAGAIPSASRAWSVITRPWRIAQDKMSNAFSSLQSSVGVINDFYGDSLSLGRGSALSETPVLSVHGQRRGVDIGRYYWRAYVYDNYTGGRWSSTLTQNGQADPETFEVLSPEFESRSVITFTVTPLVPIATLYTPEQPLWVSVPAQAYYEIDDLGYMDLAALQALPSVNANQSYEVRSSVSKVSEPELAAAGTDYPEWIAEKYLQLPDNITPRTRQLAQEIAEGLDNPYDIAKAVTNYLRKFEYSAVIETPPARREMIDWWLFEYQKGFCQYYATAEVVLLRSLGIPARLAVGYAEGEFISDGQIQAFGERDRLIGADTGTYTVRQRDAHAWPEVYFPGYGWIEFEPTASQLPVLRPSAPVTGEGQEVTPPLLGPQRLSDSELPELPPDITPAAGEPSGSNLLPAILYMLGASAIGALAYVLFLNRVRLQNNLLTVPVKLDRGFQRVGVKSPAFLRKWARYASLSPVERAYLEINRALRRLGNPPDEWLTPGERARSLERILPASKPYVTVLVAEYEHSAYSLISANRILAQNAGEKVRKISYLALIQRFLDRFRRPRARSVNVGSMLE